MITWNELAIRPAIYLKSVPDCNEIKYAGYDWIVLDKETGLILLKDAIPKLTACYGRNNCYRMSAARHTVLEWFNTLNYTLEEKNNLSEWKGDDQSPVLSADDTIGKVEKVSRQKGYWNMIDNDRPYQCSCCGNGELQPTKFCSECGAEMEGTR